MISKCANPECEVRFRYLRSGKLFHFDVSTTEVRHGTAGTRSIPKKLPHKIEHFWLCADCADSLTLKLDNKEGVIVVPIKKQRRASA